MPAGAGPALRRLAVPLGVLGSVVAAFAYVGAVDPNEPGHYPTCPLLYFTGVYCPGCGGLRSAHAVSHGDLAAALGANAVAVAGYGLFAVLWVLWAVRAVRGRPARIELGRAQLWAVGTVLALFTLVRNLPFGSWLHP
ncbi:membrane protein [Streptomyces spectabilis]|nr:membrane protein [Streptomyces spectabilis]